MNKLWAVVSCLTISNAVLAGTIRVPTDDATVAGALSVSAPGDTILLAPGIYTQETSLRLRDDQVLMSETNNPADVILQGNGSQPVILVDEGGDGITTIRGITVRNGSIGIENFWSGRTIISNCVITGNVGTGVHFFYAGLEMSDTDISDNGGPGFHLQGYTQTKHVSETTLNNCAITGNTSSDSGGGVKIMDAHIQMYDCSITGNSAVTGGGVYIGTDATYPDGAGITAYDCTIVDNFADQGSDGYVDLDYFWAHCCDLEPSNWNDHLVIVDEECGTSNEALNWGDVKSIWR